MGRDHRIEGGMKEKGRGEGGIRWEREGGKMGQRGIKINCVFGIRSCLTTCGIFNAWLIRRYSLRGLCFCREKEIPWKLSLILPILAC